MRTKSRFIRPKTLACEHCEKKFTHQQVGPRFRFCLICRIEYNEVRAKAARAVKIAIIKGKLQPIGALNCLPCKKRFDKDKPANAYHHTDYSKPLKVIPVCHYHNSHLGHAKWKPRADFFLPCVRVTLPSPTSVSDAPDCAAVTLMVAA